MDIVDKTKKDIFKQHQIKRFGDKVKRFSDFAEIVGVIEREGAHWIKTVPYEEKRICAHLLVPLHGLFYCITYSEYDLKLMVLINCKDVYNYWKELREIEEPLQMFVNEVFG